MIHDEAEGDTNDDVVVCVSGFLVVCAFIPANDPGPDPGPPPRFISCPVYLLFLYFNRVSQPYWIHRTVTSQPAMERYTWYSLFTSTSDDCSASSCETVDMEEDIDAILRGVDLHIRTRSRFDSSSPLSYSIPLSSLVSDSTLSADFENLKADYPYPELPYRSLHSLLESPVGQAKFIFTMKHGNVFVGVRHRTPMQVARTHRLFGYFQCSYKDCRNKWTSAASWTNKWQKCRRCESICYPYDQHFLENSSETRQSSSLKPHDMARCQKCQELGRICLPDRFYASSY